MGIDWCRSQWHGLIRQIRTYLRVNFWRNLPRRSIQAQGVQKYKTFNKEIFTRIPSLTLSHFHKNNCISIIDRFYFCTFPVVFVSADCGIKRMNRNTEKRKLINSDDSRISTHSLGDIGIKDFVTKQWTSLRVWLTKTTLTVSANWARQVFAVFGRISSYSWYHFYTW